MAKPHKYAWNGIDVETALSIEQVANMAQRAAAESTGDLLKGKHRIVSVKSTDRDIEFRVNDFLISFNKFMVFSLSFSESGGRTYATSTIDWYMTTQSTVGGFIPVSTKSMVAHHTYMQFAGNLAAQVRAADPSARITVREGVEPVGGAAVASAPPAELRPVPPLPHPAGGTFAAVPPPPPPRAGAPAIPPPPPPRPGGSAAIPPPPPPRTGSPVPPVPVPPVPVPPVPVPPAPVRPDAAPLVPVAPAPPVAPVPLPPPPAGPSAVSGLVTGIPGRPSAAVPPPVPPAPITGLAPLAAQMFEEDDDLDSTRMSQGGASRPWILTFSDGQSRTLDGAMRVGRDPISDGGAAAVPVDDPWKSVSKTHAALAVRDGLLWVTDLNSTNGTSVTNAVGEATSCPPEVSMPVGDGWTIAMGEFTIHARLDG